MNIPFAKLTEKQFIELENTSFDSENYVLDLMAHTDPHRPNWAGKFGLYLNGVYESYKTWPSYKKRALKIIEKYNMKEAGDVMGSFDKNGDTI